MKLNTRVNMPSISHARSIDRASSAVYAVGGITKRAFDILFSVSALILLSPLLLMVAVLVKLSDRGPIFYGHRRVGHSGRSFYCLKFRTMIVNSDAVLKAHLLENPDAQKEWTATRKLKHDPRITAVGQTLRKSSIDELPQLINILIGQMSVVGPRPVIEDELELYGPAAGYYLSTRPGLTGLWQISGRNDVSYEKRVAFDRHYVENWSVFSDLAIIAKTVPVVLSVKGSY